MSSLEASLLSLQAVPLPGPHVVLLRVCVSLVSLFVLLFYEDTSQAELGTPLSSRSALNCSVKPLSVGPDGVANVWNPSTQGPVIGWL